MSRLCAKPTCSAAAMRWLNLNAAEQRVIEESGPSESTIALCASHAERFSMPNGWTWVGIAAPESPVSPQEPTEEVSEEPTETSIGTRRRHGRDAPWFLANSDSGSSVPSAPSAASDSAASKSASVSPPAADDTDTTETEDAGAPSSGSLLHRAFHGPDPDADVARAQRSAHIENRSSNTSAQREQRTASESTDRSGGSDDDDVAPVRDMASRRAARYSSPTTYDVELPFPPAEAEPHVAVS